MEVPVVTADLIVDRNRTPGEIDRELAALEGAGEQGLPRLARQGVAGGAGIVAGLRERLISDLGGRSSGLNQCSADWRSLRCHHPGHTSASNESSFQ